MISGWPLCKKEVCDSVYFAKYENNKYGIVASFVQLTLSSKNDYPAPMMIF